MNSLANIIARALDLPVHKVENTLHLLDGGATIPFISRYRKEATGGLNEVAVGDIKEQNDRLHDLMRRKETILTTTDEPGKLSDQPLHRTAT